MSQGKSLSLPEVSSQAEKDNISCLCRIDRTGIGTELHKEAGVDGRRFRGCAQPGAPGSLPRREEVGLSNDKGRVLPHGTAQQGVGGAWAKVVDRTAGYRGNDITLCTRTLMQFLLRSELRTVAVF